MLILELLACEIVLIAAKGCEENAFPPNYNKQASPGILGEPAHLFLDLSVLDIDRIDEARMEFSIQTYLREVWNDKRLNLSCLMTENSDSDTTVPKEIVNRLWTPDLVFDNARSGVLFGLSVPNSYIALLRSGYIFRSSRYNLVVGCYMNFMLYPIDVQECFLKISLLQTPEHILLMHWASDDIRFRSYFKGVSFTHDIHALKYELLPPRAYTTRETWITANFTYLYANFTFVRKISGSLLNVYIPSTLVVFLSWTSFWIDVSAVPARITLGVTSLLTLVTQMIQARNNLPAISYMTAMDLWLFACLLQVFGSILAFTFTYRIFARTYKNTDKGLKDDTLSRKKKSKEEKEFGKLSKELLISSKIFYPRNNSLDKPTDSKKVPFNAKTVDKCSQKIFPSLFLLFAVAYWIYFLCLSKKPGV